MKTTTMPLRLEKDLRTTLREGARRTPHTMQDLIRLTLGRHLRQVIEEEIVANPAQRVTNINPWPRSVVQKAYRAMGAEWDRLEDAATKAQGGPDFND
ncbi:MAG TPA: hypothetical protein VFB72_11940, partial [Verrucomicrobiae bacterium]|nr:hypothetical protein [Verrucomicrobiae bacterium]